MADGAGLDRTFEAIAFRWVGTAVPDREADAGEVRERVEALTAAGVHLYVLDDTGVDDLDGRLRARPVGPGTLHLCLGRGSESFAVDAAGPRLVWRRESSADEEASLDEAAELAVHRFGTLGLNAKVVGQRPNRRIIDLLPDEAPTGGEVAGALAERLAAHGLDGADAALAIGQEAAHGVDLLDARVTTDGRHVEIGLTDDADTMRWIGGQLAPWGIGPALVLVAGNAFGPLGTTAGPDARLLVPELGRAGAVSVGAEPDGLPAGVHHLGGGQAGFLGLLDEQLERRRLRRVPSLDDDPGWTIEVHDDPAHRRVQESLLTTANGRIGIRGSREEDGAGTEPLLVVTGVYTGTKVPRLLPGPLWPRLMIRDSAPKLDRYRLDLRTGVVVRERGDGGRPVRTFRFASLADPRVVAMRSEGPSSRLAGGEPLAPPAPDIGYDRHRNGRWDVAVTHSTGGGHVAVATVSEETLGEGRRHIERVAVHSGDDAGAPDAAGLERQLAEVSARGFDRLLADHRAAWARRWRSAEVSIDGDPETERAVRFALYHVLGSVPDEGEAALGARGLSGTAYSGHVFWDSDVFVLPTLAAVHPAAARAMLEYRIRRLPAAMAAAAASGARGAMWPWESAGEGVDVTPQSWRAADGTVVPIRTGLREKHICADVAWAACEYAAWSGDDDFLRTAGRDLVLEGARYWASKVRTDASGRAHLYGMIGPDEYHEIVDDNAFTNVMARWHLRRAASLAEEAGGAGTEEVAAWRTMADALVDGYQAESGVYEQFTGYSKLTPMFIEDHAHPPVAADLLLGPERVRASQLIKQADVLMLFHLVPGEVVAGSLATNLDFYGPRTAHGSSLSPAIQASVLARAGRPDEALELFRLATHIDLDDLTGTTAGGLHIATMGGVWQALAYGFMGLRPRRAGLALDPVLPAAWAGLGMTLAFRGATVGVRASRDCLHLTTDRPLTVLVGGDQRPFDLPEGTTTISLSEGGPCPG